MSVLSNIRTIQLVKIQHEKRLAATSELNLAPSLVTGCCEAMGVGYWAATQVKGLSPCSEDICRSCGCKSHHCNSQFGNVVISDSRLSDSTAESSEVKAFLGGRATRRAVARSNGTDAEIPIVVVAKPHGARGDGYYPCWKKLRDAHKEASGGLKTAILERATEKARKVCEPVRMALE